MAFVPSENMFVYLTPKSPLHAMERGLDRRLLPLSAGWRGGRGVR